MLEIPLELYTPIFAIARIVGWSAHRIEELINMDKIIRPAYKSVMQELEYVLLNQRINYQIIKDCVFCAVLAELLWRTDRGTYE